MDVLLLETAKRETEVPTVRAGRRVDPCIIKVEVERRTHGYAATRPVGAIETRVPQVADAHGDVAAAHE